MSVIRDCGKAAGEAVSKRREHQNFLISHTMTFPKDTPQSHRS